MVQNRIGLGVRGQEPIHKAEKTGNPEKKLMERGVTEKKAKEGEKQSKEG